MFETLYQSETGRVLINSKTLIAEVVTGNDRTGAKLYRDASPEETLTLFQEAILKMHDDEVKARWND